MKGGGEGSVRSSMGNRVKIPGVCNIVLLLKTDSNNHWCETFCKTNNMKYWKNVNKSQDNIESIRNFI